MFISLLITILVLWSFEYFYIDYIPIAYQWIFYIGTILTTQIILAGLLLNTISYKEPLKKLLTFIAFYGTCFTALEFYVTSYIESSNILGLDIVLYFVYLVSVVYIVANCIRAFSESSDKYSCDNSYLVYQRPKHLWGLIASFITSPYGHCCLVVAGSKFSYKKGILVESDFSLPRHPPYDVILRKITHVGLLNARKLLGRKWTIFNNCFSTFRKFKND